MGEGGFLSTVQRVVGWLMLLAGIAVFLMRLKHAGPYAMPHQGNLLAAVLSLLIGLWLFRSWFSDNTPARILGWLALAASPIVLFFTLYAVFAEVEETVTLRVLMSGGETVDLRLWIVDTDGAPWVTMGKGKATAHGLEHTTAELLRNGEFSCVEVTQFADRETVNKAHHLRHEKYATQRMATLVGMFGTDAGVNTVALRLDPCMD